MSHLDLMRVFRRMFNRAEIAVKHSDGFNPHPILAAVLPLPLGQESVCEFLDVTLETEVGSFLRLPDLLNPQLPSGLHITGAYVPMMGAGEIELVRSELTAVSGEWPTVDQTINVEKTTKSGNVRRIEIRASSLRLEDARTLTATLPPDVSPQLAVSALGVEFCRIRRIAVYAKLGREFR
jgi:radical SAM-linked protein